MIGKLPEFFKSPHALANADPCEGVLIALSGGADSISLLHLLWEARSRQGFPLYAAHVNHGIRTSNYGNEAERDENFCRDLCERLGIELFVEKADVPAIAEATGASLETAARDERYAFFARIMQKKHIKILATAHNADDNFETQLFNLCRGCGIDGLCGIPETRLFPQADAIIVRPILTAPKSEILEFCRVNGLDFVTDSTNFEDDCTRNKLRLNIIPQLKEIFGSPEKASARLANAAKEASDYISAEAEKTFSDCKNSIPCELLLSSPPPISKKIIISAFRKHSSKTLESAHIESILNFAREGKNGRLSLPHNTVAVFYSRTLSFSSEKSSQDQQIEYSIPLCDGINVIEGTAFAVGLLKIGSADNNSPPEGYTEYAVAAVFAASSLYAKSRREGDTILTCGMHKKIKKLMCDKKVPQNERSHIPLIWSDEEILWAPLCAISDSAKHGSNRSEYKITLYKKQNI